MFVVERVLRGWFFPSMILIWNAPHGVTTPCLAAQAMLYLLWQEPLEGDYSMILDLERALRSTVLLPGTPQGDAIFVVEKVPRDGSSMILIWNAAWQPRAVLSYTCCGKGPHRVGLPMSLIIGKKKSR